MEAPSDTTEDDDDDDSSIEGQILKCKTNKLNLIQEFKNCDEDDGGMREYIRSCLRQVEEDLNDLQQKRLEV